MIRINLLEGGRKSAKARTPLQVGQKVTAGCSLILILSGAFIGWRYWTVDHASKQLDADIASAQRETVRLHSVIEQVQQFEQRKAQLQQRVSLIEQLRRDQTGPVHMLDQISRAMPAMLWLTDLKQSTNSNEVVIDGRCAGLTSLSDFVANLESSGYFKRSVEIVSSQLESSSGAPGLTGDLIKFVIKAQFELPTSGQSAAGEGASGQSAAVAAAGPKPTT